MATLNGNTLSFEAVLDDSDFDQGLNSIAEKALSFAHEQNRLNELAIKQQKEYVRMLTNSGEAFKKLDLGTQQQIARMSTLDNEMRRIAMSQKALNEALNSGKITQEEYDRNMSKLVANEKSLVVEMAKVTAALSQNEAVMKATNGSINEKINKLERLKEAYANLSEGDRNAANIGGRALEEIRGLEDELNKLKTSMQSMPEFKFGSIDQKTESLRKMKAEYTALSETDRKSDIGKGLAKNINAAEKEVEQLNAEFQKTESFAKKAMVAAGAYLSFQAASNFVQDVARVRGEFQKLEVTFETLLGSKEKADQLMKEMVELAATTPFELQDVAQGAKQLIALGVAAEDTTELMRRLGDIAAGGGVEIDRIIRAYGQVKALGRVRNEELLQLAEAGVPVYAEFSKVLGVAEDQVANLVNTGTVGFDKLHQVIVNLTDEGGKFGGLMSAQAETIGGKISNLSDAYTAMLNNIGKSNEGILSGSLDGAIALVENYETVLNVIKLLIATYGSYRAALIVAMAVEKGYSASKVFSIGIDRAKAAILRVLQIEQLKLNAAVLANPYVLAATALAGLVTAYVLFTDSTTAATKAQETFNNLKEEAGKSTIREKATLEELIKVAKDESKSLKDREEALKKINQISPEYLGALDLQKLKTQEGQAAIDAYNSSLDSMALKQAAMNQKVKIAEQRMDLESGNSDAVGWWDKAKAFAAAGGQNVSSAELYKKVVADKLKELDEQEAAIDKATEEGLSKLQAKIDKVKTAPERILSNREKVDAAESADAVKALIQEFSEAYGKATDDEQRKLLAGDLKYAKAREEVLNKYLESLKGAHKKENELRKEQQKFLESLAEKEKEVSRKNLSQDAAEIQAAADKYAELRKEAEKLKLGSGVKTRINRLEESETGTIRYKQETEALQKELEKQKDLYAEYEEFKTTFGEARAKERFQNELNLNKTYMQRLQQELKALESIEPAKLSGEELKRKEFLVKEREAEAKRIQAITDKQYADALKATETFEAKKLAITKKYAEMEAALRKEPATAQSEKRLKEIENLKEAELDAVKDEAFQKTKIYQELNDNLLDFTKEQIKFQIAAIEEILKTAKGLTDKQRAALEADVKSLQSLMGNATPERTTNTGAVLQKEKSLQKQLELLKQAYTQEQLSTAEYRQQAIELAEVEEQLSNITEEKFAAMAEDASNVSKEMAEWAAILAPIDEDLGHAVGQAGQLASAFGDALSAAASFASGDIIGGIKSTVAAISKVVTINKQVKEMNAAARREVAEFYDAALQGEKEYQRLLRQRELDQIRRNKLTLEGIAAEQQALQKQARAVSNDYITLFNDLMQQQYIVDSKYKHGTWIRKAKTEYTMASLDGKSYEEMEKLYLEGRLKDKAKEDFEALQQLKKELEAIGLTLEDLQDEYNKIWTGTTADSITDSIVQMFQNGVPAMKEMAANFESLMKQAMLNAFQYQYLEKEIAKFYKQFAEAAASGGVVTADEMAALRAEYDRIMGEATEQFKELAKLTELKFDEMTESAGNQQGGLEGAIRAQLTEETGSILVGHFSGLRLHVAELVQMARAQTGTATGADPMAAALLAQTTLMQDINRAILQNFQVNQQIERNTAQALVKLSEVVVRQDRQLSEQREHTRSLKSIDTKMTSTNEILRANGG